MKRAFLTAQWRWLAMLNFPIDPAVVQPLVPHGTEIDFFQGKTYVSLVGFLMLNTRVLGIPIPWYRDFEEVNLRFYVRRRAEDGWRRGVVFIREIVPRWAIAAVARWVYNEQYVALPMSHALVPPTAQAPDGRVEFSWKDAGRTHRLGAAFRGEPTQPEPESEERFITEHYWGYVRQRDGSTVEYEVKHPPWRVWRAEDFHFECDVAGFYGPQYAPALQGQPSSAFIAEGSPVSVHPGGRLQ